MKKYEDFYEKGYRIFEFDPCGLNSILLEILEGKVKEGFDLSQKYSRTLDLRPNVIDYSDLFIQVLKNNNVKKLVRETTLRDLSLYHVQVRVASSEVSYMDWHRDTYFDGIKKSGMMPPGIKIIYYPQFDDLEQDRLIVAERSQRTMIDIHENDIKLINMFPKKTISTSNSKAVLFDTSILHSVVPDKKDQPSIRLIYSFLSKEQIRDSISAGNPNGELHIRTEKLYDLL